MSQDTAKPSDNCHQPENRLYPEDQNRVDQYLKEGVNEVERSPFRPLRLMAWLTAVILVLGVLSRLIGYFVIPS
ncbi:DUF3094 family protein [Endozoicomonas sp.]|uniref:DUF3094 family protein n=1 Tax=Endozoicomonas sp. TaxID=1892382 RepID=UPI002885AF6A|nr:DUF3094 family protein [Endozoicomonas sp.]